MMKVLIHQKAITIINKHINIKVQKYMKETLTEL